MKIIPKHTQHASPFRLLLIRGILIAIVMLDVSCANLHQKRINAEGRAFLTTDEKKEEAGYAFYTYILFTEMPSEEPIRVSLIRAFLGEPGECGSPRKSWIYYKSRP